MTETIFVKTIFDVCFEFLGDGDVLASLLGSFHSVQKVNPPFSHQVLTGVERWLWLHHQVDPCPPS